MTETIAPTIGHNKPPLYDEALEKSFAAKLKDAERVLKQYSTIEEMGQENAEELADFIAQVTALKKKVGESGREQRKPIEDDLATVKQAFGTIEKKLTLVEGGGKLLIAGYMKATGARQVKSRSGVARTISAQSVKKVEVENVRRCFSYFADDPEVKEFLEKRATAVVRAKDGPETLPGCKITDDLKAV